MIKMKKLTVTALALTMALACAAPAFALSRRPVETLTPSPAVSQQAAQTARTSAAWQTAGASETQQTPAVVTAPTPEQRKITRTYIAEKGKELGSFGDWSLEDKHEYSLCVEAQGIPQDQTVHGLPGEDNMSRDEAVRLAQETIMNTYRLKQATLDRFNVQVEFNVIDAENPVWQIYFDVKDTNDFAALGLYRVFINDATKEIVKLEDASSYAIPVGELTTVPGAAG